MRAVLQRVERAEVRVAGQVVGAIARGFVILLGVAEGDGDEDLARLLKKVPHLRVFDDDQGRPNRSLLDCAGAALVVSQFTLLADTKKGRRPSYTRAMEPQAAAALVERFAQGLREQGIAVAQGLFGAHMAVDLVNDGPVTIVLDTKQDL